MRYLVGILTVFALFLFALFIAPLVIGEKGYILIALGNWTIEFSVVSLGFMLLMLAVGIYLVMRLMKIGVHSAGGLKRWLGGRTSRAQDKAFYQGLYALALGDQTTASTAFKKVQCKGFHGFHYVALGQLALQQNDEAKATYWFDEAKAINDPVGSKTVAILLAQHHLLNNRADLALESLDEINEQKDPLVLKVRSQAMARAKQWDALQAKLPGWKRSLGKNYGDVMQDVASQQFSEIASKQGANQLKVHWEGLPRKQRNDEAYRLAFFNQLLDQGMHQDAQDYLVKWYKSTPVPGTLLDAIKRLRLPNPAPTIKLLEHAIKQHPEEPTLYATLGHVAYFSNDMTLSEQALAKAITLEESKAELMLLADIYQQNQAYDEAIQAMRRVADLTN